MSQNDEEFLKRFFRALADRPLDPVLDEKLYVPLYADKAISSSDPVSELEATIEWSGTESAQLFSGFRGTGKSTELGRLKRKLEKSGCIVVLCDMRQYMNLSTPVDVSDFLLSAAGAFGEALAKDKDLLGQDVIREGYWRRFWNFLSRTQIDLSELGLSVGVGADPVSASADIKMNLKDDPTFREILQARLKGHIGALVKDVRGFFGECILALRRRHDDENLRVVLLLDSVEQVRGTSVNATEVASSLETLFEGHADRLKIPYLHVVYTVPPWLKIKAPGVAGLYSGAQLIPCVKVRNQDGTICRAGLDELERIVALRGDWRKLLGPDRAALDALLLASGGYLRDLFRLIQTVLRLTRNETVPAGKDVQELALHEVRNTYLPITNDDSLWLQRIQATQSTQLKGLESLPDLSRFFDTHLVLTYRNGVEWVSVHPLVAEQVARQAAETTAWRAKEVSGQMNGAGEPTK